MANLNAGKSDTDIFDPKTLDKLLSRGKGGGQWSMENESGAERKWLEDVMSRNAEKKFVKRFNQPEVDRESIDNGNGSFSTHSMSHEVDGEGQWSAFPTVEDYGGGMERYELRHAQQLARQTGNEVLFDNQDDAEFFSKNYKRLWEKPRGGVKSIEAVSTYVPFNER